MKHIKLFIWDFDGTLMDTYPFITGCLQQALRDCGHEVDRTEILGQMLDTIPHAIQFYAEKLGIPDLKERYNAYYKEMDRADIRLFPGVKEVLARVREIGADNYVFTNRGTSVYTMLERAGVLGEFREIVMAKSERFTVKPAPDSILYLMEKYGGTTETTVMIGDRVCDLESGYSAGCKTCHLLTPSVPQYPRCDWRIGDFGEMLELLGG